MWERACSRKRCFSQPIWRLIHRFREQARSHIFLCMELHRVIGKSRAQKKPRFARSHALRGNAAQDAPRPKA
ncbi:hypothetical protein DCC84_06400 [Pseudomonas sp. SXM-1]|nr:hypothetical protein DCC84_06400 [Pseudomonas sp. SXM-1]